MTTTTTNTTAAAAPTDRRRRQKHVPDHWLSFRLTDADRRAIDAIVVALRLQTGKVWITKTDVVRAALAGAAKRIAGATGGAS